MKEKLNPYFASLADSAPNAFAKFGEGSDWLSWADPFYPESRLPAHVREACVEALDGPGAHYTVPMGLEALRVVAAEKVKKFNGLDIDPMKELFIIAGSDTGLFYAMMPFITPGAGDEVLIPDPSYVGNFTNAALLGAKAVSVPLDEKNNFTFNFDALENATTERSRLLVLTNPNNPTGRSYTREELTKLAAFVERHDLAVVVDQAFEDCVFSGHEMVTFASLPGMYERTTTVFTTSKGMGLCGFRVAYIVSCPRFSKAYQAALVSVGGAPNTVAQYGALAAFKNIEFLHSYTEKYEQRTRRTWEMLRGVPGIRCNMPDAGYYLWINVSELGPVDKLLEFIANDAHVVLTGGDGFGKGGANYLRLITASMSDDEKYYDAIRRLCFSLAKYAGKKYNKIIIDRKKWLRHKQRSNTEAFQ